MECKCYNHTARNLARGIMGTRCQRLARWDVTIAGSVTPCCDKHKQEMMPKTIEAVERRQ